MQAITTILLNLINGCSWMYLATVKLVAAYDLIVIEDEATPLAASANVNYYLPTVLGLLVVILLGLLVCWILKRNNYKNRLFELREKNNDSDRAVPFTIRSIKDEISRLETELVSDFL